VGFYVFTNEINIGKKSELILSVFANFKHNFVAQSYQLLNLKLKARSFKEIFFVCVLKKVNNATS
jgi:hypothetical protein